MPQSDPMRRALDLARDAPAPTSPNPTVGAAVVAAGEIVGEGVTQPPPGPHAEILALQQAGEHARGGTLYVTLEPCAHHGRTPPCTEAIIAAGVAEVRYAVADPDPRVDGAGHQALEAAGVRVVAGEGKDEARRINEAYFKHREHGLPFVIAKFAVSLDGRIAAASGDSRWISGPEARYWAHDLRARIDAIVVGSQTVVVDDPLLTARPNDRDADRQPLRIVVDTRGRTPPMARVFESFSASGGAQFPTLVATVEDAPAAWRSSLEARGAEVVSFPRHGDNVDLLALLYELARRDILSVLVEGGGVMLGGFFDRSLVDKVHAVIAPLIVGAANAPTAVAGHGAYRMADALRLRDISVEPLGDDILVTGYPRYPEPAE